MEIEQFLLGLASGIILTFVAEFLRLRAERKRRRQEAFDADRERLAGLVPPLRRAIECANEIWLGMMGRDGSVNPRSIPLDDELRAVVSAWTDTGVGPLVQDHKVREAYWGARVGMWANHWDWLRTSGLRATILDLDLGLPAWDDPEVPPGLSAADKACWYSAKHIAADLQALAEEIERYVSLY